MSDSGRAVGDCVHGANPWWCCHCLHTEVERLRREYAELKTAIWHEPGEPAESFDDMTNAQTIHQARDQSLAFRYTNMDAVTECERLRELARSCARDLRLAMQVLMTRSHAVESIADRLEREANG